MSVFRSSLRLVSAARAGLTLRAAPAVSVAVRHGGGGPKPVSNVSEPNGFLFNEKPLLPGEKRQKEEWENPFVYGMALNFLLILIIAFFKPDTSMSAWAHEKALQKLEAEAAILAAETAAAD
ncbi:hypothetical protein GBAR_LOCUS1562 [Geodia barretti]|uniref:NADH dehydrogenase [ubiquinone] 1 beta subcomplex subunit 11, mitochondrial n=1 Tax=Geodia barretti TaxID=519541 RepID=A0AA35QXV6_GEOBA|nr:hypothetical protein GBAR_LOCUS1562 [Geodia barretti]